VIQCAAYADGYDDTRDTYLDEGGTSYATVNGSTATCTVTLPYSWPLASPSTDTVELSYEIQVFSPTAPYDAYDDRYSEHTINRSLPMPANGATTSIDVTTTI
jgi:hypothetical protein